MRQGPATERAHQEPNVPFILFSICLFLIFCALYGISSGVNAVLPCPVVLAAGRTDDTLGQCIADLDRLFELQQCGALTRHEFEALKHHLMQRAASAA